MSPFTRREFLASAAAVVLAARGFGQDVKDVAWLDEIQLPPAELPADAPRLSNLLVDKGGESIKTKEEWLTRREEIRRWWLEFLGPEPAERGGPPKLEVVEEDRPEGVIRQLVRYDVEPGLATEAYLLKPAKVEGKAPGIVALHSTVDHSIRQPAGVEGAPEKAFGLRYAKQGCVVFCPRNFLWPTTGKIAAQAEADKFLKRVPREKGTQSKGMMKMLYDSLVATDILAALPEVDAKRLGAIGHSLGAKEVLYLAAFDERIKVSVSSEGGIGTKFSNWDAPW